MTLTERRSEVVDAQGQRRSCDQTDPASALFVVRAPRDATTPEADALRAEIARLYRQLQALPFPDQPGQRRTSRGSARWTTGSLAYTALETQIRRLARRHWVLTDVE